MPELRRPTTETHTHDRLRAKVVTIDNFTEPKEVRVDPEWAAVDAEGNFIYDPKRGHKGTDVDSMRFLLDDVGTEVIAVQDPVTGSETLISGYGLAMAIEKLVADQLLAAQPDEIKAQIEVVE